MANNRIDFNIPPELRKLGESRGFNSQQLEQITRIPNEEISEEELRTLNGYDLEDESYKHADNSRHLKLAKIGLLVIGVFYAFFRSWILIRGVTHLH